MDTNNNYNEFKKKELESVKTQLEAMENKKAFDTEVNKLIIDWAKKELKEYENNESN